MGRRRALSVLQIDAHADLRNSYQGSRFSHASVMRRVLELGADVVTVGVRSLSAECSRVLRSRSARVTAIGARECLESPDWIERAVAALGPRAYVTVDIDGFDPAYAPGTGTPEPGGLDWHGVCSLLRAVAAQRQVIGADVVEVAPIAGQHTTEFLAARLAYKLIGYHHSSP
jgi:agmatinase